MSEGPEEKQFNVGSETNPRKLAGAIVHAIQEGNVTVSAIGEQSTHRMVLALATIAQWGHKPPLVFATSGTDHGTKISCTVHAYNGEHTKVIE